MLTSCSGAWASARTKKKNLDKTPEWKDRQETRVERQTDIKKSDIEVREWVSVFYVLGWTEGVGGEALTITSDIRFI